MFPDYPYTDSHQLNLDWILSTIIELKDIVEHGGGGGDVQSVNGKTGVVILTYSDVGALSSATVIPTKTSQLLNDSGFLTSAPVASVNGKTGIVVLTPSDIGAYQKPASGIPASDLASGVIPSVPSASSANPQNLGTASAGTSNDYSRADHIHNMPSASDVGAAPVVTEITNSTAGAVTQALDAGKIYHFTGALTSLTITLNAAGAGIIPQYHFDFDSGSTAPTVTLPGTVTMEGGTFTPEASKHYEIDILNNYGVYVEW